MVGAWNTNFQNYTGVSNQTIQLAPGNQITLMTLGSTNAPGYVELPLNQFQLFVPKNTPKQTGSYQTSLRWTISATP